MILYSHARRETWRRESWKKEQFISLRNSKWWEDARSYSHFWKSRCFAQTNLHSIQRVFPILPYTFTAHKTFYSYANYFLPMQITFFYANFLPPKFSKENFIRGRHARQMTSYKESSLNIKIGKVSVERNRTALPGAQDELIVKPKKA